MSYETTLHLVPEDCEAAHLIKNWLNGTASLPPAVDDDYNVDQNRETTLGYLAKGDHAKAARGMKVMWIATVACSQPHAVGQDVALGLWETLRPLHVPPLPSHITENSCDRLFAPLIEAWPELAGHFDEVMDHEIATGVYVPYDQVQNLVAWLVDILETCEPDIILRDAISTILPVLQKAAEEGKGYWEACGLPLPGNPFAIHGAPFDVYMESEALRQRAAGICDEISNLFFTPREPRSLHDIARIMEDTGRALPESYQIFLQMMAWDDDEFGLLAPEEPIEDAVPGALAFNDPARGQAPFPFANGVSWGGAPGNPEVWPEEDRALYDRRFDGCFPVRREDAETITVLVCEGDEIGNVWVIGADGARPWNETVTTERERDFLSWIEHLIDVEKANIAARRAHEARQTMTLTIVGLPYHDFPEIWFIFRSSQGVELRVVPDTAEESAGAIEAVWELNSRTTFRIGFVAKAEAAQIRALMPAMPDLYGRTITKVDDPGQRAIQVSVRLPDGVEVPASPSEPEGDEPVWTTNDGRKIAVSKMADSHLGSVLRYIRQNAQHYRLLVLGRLLRQMPAHEAAQAALMAAEDEALARHDLWPHLAGEAVERGLAVPPARPDPGIEDDLQKALDATWPPAPPEEVFGQLVRQIARSWKRDIGLPPPATPAEVALVIAEHAARLDIEQGIRLPRAWFDLILGRGCLAIGDFGFSAVPPAHKRPDSPAYLARPIAGSGWVSIDRKGAVTFTNPDDPGRPRTWPTFVTFLSEISERDGTS